MMGSSDITDAHMIRAAGSVGCAAQGEDDHVHAAGGSAVRAVEAAHHSVCIGQEVMRILLPRLSQRGVDIDSHPPALARANETGLPLKAWPVYSDCSVSVHCRLHLKDGVWCFKLPQNSKDF